MKMKYVDVQGVRGNLVKKFKNASVIEQPGNGIWVVPHKRDKKNCPVGCTTLKEALLHAKLMDYGVPGDLITDFYNAVVEVCEN
jgi:hypothetical protein